MCVKSQFNCKNWLILWLVIGRSLKRENMLPVVTTRIQVYPYVTFTLKDQLHLHFNAQWVPLTTSSVTKSTRLQQAISFHFSFYSSVKIFGTQCTSVMFVITHGSERVSRSSLKFKGSFRLRKTILWNGLVPPQIYRSLREYIEKG